MAEFFYRAAKRDGSLTEGVLTADSKALALRQLKLQGLTLLKLDEMGDGSRQGKSQAQQASLARNEVLSVTNELAVLLRAGLPIDRALKILIEMSASPNQIRVLTSILETVKSGKGLSQALAPYESTFGYFYINMIRAGEASGQLGDVLTRLAAYLENAKEIRSSVVSALVYPAILLVVATLSIFLMLGFVVPQFETLFSDMGDALPTLTRGVIDAGNAVKSYGWVMLIVVFIIGFMIRQWASSDRGALKKDQFILSLPIVGSVAFKYEMAKFSRTLGTLLGNGVSLLSALSIAIGAVGNRQVKASLSVLEPAVKQGERMSLALQKTEAFTPMVVQMIRVGEESGSLDNMMLELAKVYDNEVQSGVKRGLTLLEPMLILGMGGVIAVIIIAILMGILSVNDLAV